MKIKESNIICLLNKEIMNINYSPAVVLKTIYHLEEVNLIMFRVTKIGIHWTISEHIYYINNMSHAYYKNFILPNNFSYWVQFQ
jgi:hypothetical protein